MPTPPKRKPDSARRANRIIQQRTLLLLALLGIGTFLLLFAQLYKLQIKQHDELKTLAVRQQTLRTTVEASRGTIYDKNGDILALSSTAENVCVSPLDVAKNEQDQDLIANGLGEILGVDPGGILDDMKDTASQYKVIKKKVEQETADKVRVFISGNDIKGVFLEPTSKRYYPYSSLAAHVIGFVNANGGAYGLEAVYDEELTGEKGMVVSARDANGNALLYQYEQYFDAENGDSLVTTLDKTVQYYLEKGLEELESRYGTGVGATGIVMDVNTGGILAMASLPTYDLNAPASIYNKEMLAAGMTDEELAAAADTLQNMQWRNKAINDTFQPGSTFKILTLAMALEENKVKMSDTFNCPGYVVIEGAKINCSKRAPGHGHQDLITAFANSCNPAFINIGLRLGNTTFYNYMKAFGLTGKTGVDTTGEASGFVNKEIEYSTLALACYAFGQNFNVTPLSLINAQAACVNGGYLRTPYIVSEVLDQSGNVKYRHDTTPLRQVISEDTSKTVREIMEYEVEHGTGKNGKVAGYRIGGKTGTADQIDGSVTVSFTCCAPADDPQIMMHQHHGIFFRVRVGGVDLGMAVKMGIAIGSFSVIKFQRLIQGFLIQGICAGGVYLTGHCQLDNLFYTLECGIAALHTHLCQLELVDIFDQVQMQHINGAGGEQRIADFLAAVDHDIFPANKLFGLFKHFDVTHNYGAAVRVLFGICQRLDGDFRAGTRRIAHGNANDGFCHKSAPLNPCLWRQHLPAPS